MRCQTPVAIGESRIGTRGCEQGELVTTAQIEPIGSTGFRMLFFTSLTLNNQGVD